MRVREFRPRRSMYNNVHKNNTEGACKCFELSVGPKCNILTSENL